MLRKEIILTLGLRHRLPERSSFLESCLASARMFQEGVSNSSIRR